MDLRHGNELLRQQRAGNLLRVWIQCASVQHGQPQCLCGYGWLSAHRGAEPFAGRLHLGAAEVSGAVSAFSTGASRHACSCRNRRGCGRRSGCWDRTSPQFPGLPAAKRTLWSTLTAPIRRFLWGLRLRDTTGSPGRCMAAPVPANEVNGSQNYNPAGFSAAAWHTYGMIWSKGQIQYYVDSPSNIYATFNTGNFGGNVAVRSGADVHHPESRGRRRLAGQAGFDHGIPFEPAGGLRADLHELSPAPASSGPCGGGHTGRRRGGGYPPNGPETHSSGSPS